MALVLERRELGPPAGSPTDGYAPPTPPRRRMQNQDHDAEERGVLLPSSPSSPIAGLDQPQISFSGGRTEGVAQVRDSPDDSPSSESPATAHEQHALDGFRSGQYVVANLHLMSTIRDEWMRHTQDAASSRSAPIRTEAGTGTGRPGTGTTTTRQRMPVRPGVRRMGRRGGGGGEWGARLGFAVGSGLAGWR